MGPRITDKSRNFTICTIFCVIANFVYSGLKILPDKRVTRNHVKCQLHMRHTSTVTS